MQKSSPPDIKKDIDRKGDELLLLLGNVYVDCIQHTHRKAPVPAVQIKDAGRPQEPTELTLPKDWDLDISIESIPKGTFPL